MWELGPKPEIDSHHDVRHRVVGCAEFPKRAWLEREGAGNPFHNTNLPGTNDQYYSAAPVQLYEPTILSALDLR